MGCSRTRQERLDNLANKTTTNLRFNVTCLYFRIKNTGAQVPTRRTFVPQTKQSPKKTAGWPLDTRDSFRKRKFDFLCYSDPILRLMVTQVAGGGEANAASLHWPLARCFDERTRRANRREKNAVSRAKSTVRADGLRFSL